LTTPDLKAADFNGDGLADLVVTDSNAVVVGMNTTSTFHFSFSPAELPAVHSGGSTSLTVNLKALNGFGNAVTLACSAPASLGINCSLSSTSVMPGGSATLTVKTAGSSTAMNRSRNIMRFLYALCLPIFGPIFAGMIQGEQCQRRRKRLSILSFFLFAGVFLQAACGGSNGTIREHGTPPGSYTITVTGTSGSTQHSATTILMVQ
jgi:trimeric autotransporter adhesin